MGELFRTVCADGFSVVTALRFSRIFLGILGKARERIATEHNDLLAKDQTAYKQTTDGIWLREREERLSALTESKYVKVRANLILKMIESLGDTLRTKYQSPFLDLPEYRTSSVNLAGRVSSAELLKRLDALQSLMDYLSRNVQEALAIEVAFLEGVWTCGTKNERWPCHRTDRSIKENVFVMQLFLLRHAEAESNAASDEARALTVKGTKQAEAIGKFCLEHDFVPELILSSPLTRAEETARLVARELNLPKLVQIVEFLRAGMTAERAFSGLRESLIGSHQAREILGKRGHHVGGSRTRFQRTGWGVDWGPGSECSFS